MNTGINKSQKMGGYISSELRQEEEKMSDICEVVLTYYKEVWGKHNLNAIKELTAKDYKRHISPVLPPLDAQAQIERVCEIQSAFPDIVNIPVDIIGKDNIVFVRLVTYCTHLGTFMDIEPTGKTVCNSAIEEFLMEDDKIAEHWGGPDIMDIKRQIEA